MEATLKGQLVFGRMSQKLLWRKLANHRSQALDAGDYFNLDTVMLFHHSLVLEVCCTDVAGVSCDHRRRSARFQVPLV